MWLAFVLAISACGSDKDPPPYDPSCEADPDPHCAHPIDHVLVPRLRELGVPIRDASAEERPTSSSSRAARCCASALGAMSCTRIPSAIVSPMRAPCPR